MIYFYDKEKKSLFPVLYSLIILGLFRDKYTLFEVKRTEMDTHFEANHMPERLSPCICVLASSKLRSIFFDVFSWYIIMTC